MATGTFNLALASAAVLGLAGAATAGGFGLVATVAPTDGEVFETFSSTPLEDGAAVQGPLQLYYQTTDQGNGTWLYNFTLKNTNIDGSWAPGQNFNWIIWGDQQQANSNLTGWVGDPASIIGSNFADEGFLNSSGFHNGPTLLDVDGLGGGSDGWIPAGVGDVFTWSGTATVDLPEPELLWSNLVGTGTHADFLPAIKIVPAPGAGALLGLAGLAATRRRR